MKPKPLIEAGDQVTLRTGGERVTGEPWRERIEVFRAVRRRVRKSGTGYRVEIDLEPA
jgi:hypothetical protein